MVLSWASMKKHILIFNIKRKVQDIQAVWQIDVCSQGRPLHYIERIDVARGGGVSVYAAWKRDNMERESIHCLCFCKLSRPKTLGIGIYTTEPGINS